MCLSLNESSSLQWKKDIHLQSAEDDITWIRCRDQLCSESKFQLAKISEKGASICKFMSL